MVLLFQTGLRHGGDHRLPQDLLQSALCAQPVPERRGDASRGWRRCSTSASGAGSCRTGRSPSSWSAATAAWTSAWAPPSAPPCAADPVILFEYDNGGYMNTGYQLSYSTPMGAKSSTSHVGKDAVSASSFFHKDTPHDHGGRPTCPMRRRWPSPTRWTS